MKTIILKIYLFASLSLVKVMSVHGQSYFDVNKDFPCAGCGNYTANLSSLKKYSFAQIQEIFDSLSKSGIEFRYPQGGCQNRAEAMSLIMTKKYNFQHDKIWLFAPVDLIVGDKRTLEVDDVNGIAPNYKVKWNYHVAPCVISIDKGQTDTLIIDPSIYANGPLKIRDWFVKITNSDISSYTILNPTWYFFNTADNGSSPVLSGYFYDYSSTNYCHDAIHDLTLEKGLAENDLAMYVLTKYMKTTPIDSLRFNSFKHYIGQVTVLENNFLGRQEYCGTSADNISYRTLIKNYPEIMNDVMRYYQERLTYWVLKMDELR